MTQYSFLLDKNASDALASEQIFFEAAKIGSRVFFSDTCRVGKNFGYWSRDARMELFRIGSNSYSFSSLSQAARVGSYCSIAAGVFIRPPNHPYWRWSTSPCTYDPNNLLWKHSRIRVAPQYPGSFFSALPPAIDIMPDSWIGMQSMLSPGITLGIGCVVAARSNVTRDVPAYAVVGGNPAKLIKYRFSEAIIADLLQSKWFEYDITALPIAGDLPVEKFLEEITEAKQSGLLPRLYELNFRLILDELHIVYS